eukprot:tig00000789_g4119.t1
MNGLRIWREPLAFLGTPSAGAINGQQIAMQDCDRLYVASGSRVHVCSPGYPPEGECTYETAKEGNAPLPNRLRVVRDEELQGLPHRAEIMSLQCEPPEDGSSQAARLGSVDASGVACITRLEAGAAPTAEGRCSVLRPQAAGPAEPGWAGIAFNPRKPAECAVARFFPKAVVVYDGERAVRELHAAQHPTGAVYVDEHVLALTELNQLSVWDLREKRACVERVTPSLEAQLCVASSGTGLVACAGADRSVHVYDARKWTPVARWPGALKFEATWLAFSRRRPNTVYVGALDNEFACAGLTLQGRPERAAAVAAEEAGKRYSFRADGRWVGLALHAASDAVAGLTDIGTLYLIQHG